MRTNTLLILFLFFLQNLFAQTTNIVGPAGSERFGGRIVVLPNGNYVVTDPNWDDGATANVGAVYLYDGSTHALISTLTGSNTDDQVGRGVTVLTNGNYVINSPFWNNGAATDAGAVTWADGTTGVSGIVSSSNSLVGDKAGDVIGLQGVVPLANGNYVVRSANWNNGTATNAGAVTWADGTTGITGVVSDQNSLVGTTAFDQIGIANLITFSNGNYVVGSTIWDNGTATNAGAVTWGSGTSGVSGVVSDQNSLVGTTTEDRVGRRIIPLTNGNYVVSSQTWDNGAIVDVGAATWGNGTTGITGAVSDQNSLVGTTAFDRVSSSAAVPLPNGNYVVGSALWDNGTVADAGAVTWGDGTTGITGAVSDQNSLVGSSTEDRVGDLGIAVLTNSNYIIGSPFWDNGIVADAGAVTWGDGHTGVTGVVDAQNSLIGSTAADEVGNRLSALANGNYVVCSSDWDNGAITNAGAVTWGNGKTGITGTISDQNSLVGSTVNDFIGTRCIVPLPDGNYVVGNPTWNNGTIVDAGAATFCNGTTGRSGTINDQNSLVGSTVLDRVGESIIIVGNGTYVVRSSLWDDGTVSNVGAVTFCDIGGGVVGAVSDQNSLVGSSADDQIGNGNVSVLPSGDYVICSPLWDNGSVTDAGAATWCDGTFGTTGVVSDQNSLVGTTAFDRVSNLGAIPLTNGNYVVVSTQWNNGAITNAGALTWASGSNGISGVVRDQNSLVGSTAADFLGGDGVTALPNGNYVVRNTGWDNGSMVDAGAVTLGNGVTGTTGFINSCNSVLGNVANASTTLSPTFNEVSGDLLVGKQVESVISVFQQSAIPLADNLDNEMRTISGAGVVDFITPDCQIIATLNNSTLPSSVIGDVEATVWIENTQPMDFVKRHYDITPTDDAATASGRVTLYFTQAEFDDFNAVAPIKLPTSSTDALGISNVLIEKRTGSSDDGTGLPNSYDAGFSNIDPDDNDVVWNAEQMRWEITFDVTGFSGFFLKTQDAILPVELLSFNAKVEGQTSLLTWRTASEVNNKGSFVERSQNGKVWKDLGFVAGAGSTLEQQSYAFVDVQPLVGLNYYRLRQVDLPGSQAGHDGTFEYSEIKAINFDGKDNTFEVFPNPTSDLLQIQFASSSIEHPQLAIFDLNGRLFWSQDYLSKEGIDIRHLAAGTYVLRVTSGAEVQQLRFVKL
ncbi:MAG: T9SS type A sorting domain-containing protein [Bacteroidota bacterium]